MGAILAGNPVDSLVQRTGASQAMGRQRAWLGGQKPRREPGRVVVIDLLKIHLIDTSVSSSTVFGRRDDDQTLASCHYRGVLNAHLPLQTSITRTTR